MRFWSIGPPVAFLDDHHGSLACVDHARNIRKRSGEIVGSAVGVMNPGRSRRPGS